MRVLYDFFGESFSATNLHPVHDANWCKDAFGTKSHPGIWKNYSFSFLCFSFQYCECFYFRPSDTHNFVHFFHPLHELPSSPELFSLSDVQRPRPFAFPISFFLIIFHCRLCLAIQKCATQRGGSFCRLFLSAVNFLRASCWCHLLLALPFLWHA